MERLTKYFARDEGYPRYVGPDELSLLGAWVTGDIQLAPNGLVEVIDLVSNAGARTTAKVEELSGNGFLAEFGTAGMRLENHFVETLSGDFTLEQTLEVLLDFWTYCMLVVPEKAEEARLAFAAQHRRDPVAPTQ